MLLLCLYDIYELKMCANDGSVPLSFRALVIFKCLCSLVRFFCEFPSPLEERNLVRVETDFSHAFVLKISPILI